MLSHLPPPRVTLHHAGLCLCFYLQGSSRQPPGSPSQMCCAGIELAGLQSEAAGKFLSSGRWHEGRLPPQLERLPQPAHPLLSRLSLPPCNRAVPIPAGWREVTRCCQGAARIPALLQEFTPPGRPCAGQLAVPQPSPHRLSPQGFVLGVVVTPRCPACILGFPLQISSSRPEPGGDLVGLHKVMAHERETKSRQGGKGSPGRARPEPLHQPPSWVLP